MTETFPFRGPDDPFLPREVEVLSRQFDLHFVPTSADTTAPLSSLSGSIDIDVNLANSSVRGALPAARNLFAGEVRQELRNQSERSITARAVIARRWSRVIAGKGWALRHLTLFSGHRPTLVYSWWGSPELLGVAETLRAVDIPVVTRMHGYDLYAEQSRLGFIPFQRRLINSVDKVFSASEAGKNYLYARYPEFASKIDVAYLGVDAAPALSPPSEDGKFRIVSCSTLIPLKRIEVLIESIQILLNRNINIFWTHIGTGPLRESITELAAPLGDRAQLLGQMEQTDVISWMSSHPIDVFCNVSSSEGLPVSLMEAASCGIPLLATDVGGNSEIVDNNVGRLVASSASAGVVAETLISMATQPKSVLSSWRRNSYLRWKASFQAERNYGTLAEEFNRLFKSTANPISDLT